MQTSRIVQLAARISSRFQFEKPHDPGESSWFSLTADASSIDSARTWRSVKVLAKINIEKRAVHLGAWHAGIFYEWWRGWFPSAVQRSEADGACTLCQRLHCGVQARKIPRDRFGDFKTRLTGMVHDHLDGS